MEDRSSSGPGLSDRCPSPISVDHTHSLRGCCLQIVLTSHGSSNFSLGPAGTGLTRDGDVAQLVERRTGTPLTQVRFHGATRDFSPRVNFRCRLSYGVRTLPCAIACIYICANVTDPVVYVRVRGRWIMETTLKHPPCIVGRVARLCCSWLSPGKAIRISHRRNPIGTIQL